MRDEALSLADQRGAACRLVRSLSVSLRVVHNRRCLAAVSSLPVSNGRRCLHGYGGALDIALPAVTSGGLHFGGLGYYAREQIALESIAFRMAGVLCP